MIRNHANKQANKHVKKRILSSVIALALGASILMMDFAPVYAEAKDFSVTEGIDVSCTATAQSVGELKGASKTTTITVKNADLATAKKLHKVLFQGKPATLKIKGDSKTAKNKADKLCEKIGKVSKTGVIFQYTMGKKDGAYYTVNISTDNAKMYKYAVSYIKKLDRNLQKSIEKKYAGIQDLQKYPDEKVCKARILYDYLVESFTDYYQYVNTVTVTGADAKTTKSYVFLNDFWDGVEEGGKYYNLLVADKIEEENVEYEEWEDGEYWSWQAPNVTYKLRSFEEFYKIKEAREIAKSMQCYDLPDQRMYQLYTSDFCELSDAMKVYAIAKSNYFGCNYSRPEFGMIYDYTWEKPAGWKGMKILYDNKAVGVCEVHAYYEDMIFTQLGITSYINSSYKINHAWSVVKVKNSKGKTLWVPFDYGIGPANGLVVSADQRKHIDTEAKQYKLYLSGIQGAPSKKNFTDEDFN